MEGTTCFVEVTGPALVGKLEKKKMTLGLLYRLYLSQGSLTFDSGCFSTSKINCQAGYKLKSKNKRGNK
jgi:hypothetical protein